jgi:holo-[acyl-carrier protein] synthase
VEVERVSRAIERWGSRFLDRIYAPGELNRRRTHPRAFAEHAAGRFAAKEAAMKALGTGWRGLRFREIVVVRLPSGKPSLRLEGRARRRADELEIVHVEVTITHTASTAAAVVAMLSG